MKFTIQSLEQQTVQTKYGPKQKFRFTSSGQTYDAWAKKGYTDHFREGYSFEADLAGKPYKGIDSVQWPKSDYQGPGQSGGKDNSAQLDRIEQKLDILMKVFAPTVFEPLKNLRGVVGEKVEIPFAGSPPPDENDRGPF